MAYQALYRRWRPMTFGQVLGQTATVKTLRHQIETGQIAHAYLFCGCHGTGKTTLAKLMSRAVNCKSPKNGEPCGECEVCAAIQHESAMDVLEIDAASNNSVDNIRDLLEQVRYPPQLGRYKVYIIDEVHMLSTAAFNALLKTLEEPPPHVVFILATTEPQKLPATILSRVQRYDFGRIPASFMIERMREALAEMSMSAEDEALGMVARAAEGAMRDAFSILDMCVAGAENACITASQVRDVLGSADREFTFEYADCLMRRDTAGVMRMTDELMRSGREPQVFLRELSSHVRALLTVRAVDKDAASILEVTEDDEKRYREQAKGFSGSRLLRMLDSFIRAESELRFASSPRIGLEAAALRVCEPNTAEDSEALLERLGEVEAKLRKLEDDIESGRLAPVQSSGEKTAPKRKLTDADKTSSEPDKPVKAVQKPVAGGDKDVWKAALASLRKNDPPTFMLVSAEKFLGAENDVYRVEFPLAKKDFSYVKVTQPKRIEIIEKALTNELGRPARFAAVLENEPDINSDESRQDNQQQLFEAFGRDNVQIDEDAKQ